MTKARPLALFSAIAVAGSLAYAALLAAGGAPLDAVPAASFLVATIDVAALRASALYPTLFESAPQHAEDNAGALSSGLAELGRACGFDPVSRIGELDIAVPEGGEPGDFGIAASAEVTREELVRCAENVANARGERHQTETVGPYHLLEDERGHALAVRDTGTILVGKGTWIRTMIDASDRKTPGIRASRQHMALRDALVPQGTRPLAVITALLPKNVRDRIKREMATELSDSANTMMAAVLGVTAAGVAVRTTGNGTLEARVELQCESEGACADVKRLVLAKRLAWSQDLTLRIVGLGPPIDALEVETHGISLTATTHAGVAELAAAIERVQKLHRGREQEKRPRPPKPADEVLRPRADAGATPH